MKITQPKIGVCRDECRLALAFFMIFVSSSFLRPVSAFAASKASVAACELAHPMKAVVVSIDENLQLTLDDGRVLRIGNIEAPTGSPSDPELGARGRDWLAALLADKEIQYETLDARPDRWGRLEAVVFVASGSEMPGRRLSVGESLAQLGLVRVVPDQLKNPCEKRILEAESAARAGGVGLWSDPYYAVLTATDASAFAEHAGSFIVVEGRVTEVRNGATRTMLFFGAHRRDSLAVTLLQRNVKIFEAAGLHFHDLIGQTLRVRGLLETRFGPEIEVTHPNEIEIIAKDTSAAEKPVQAATRP